MLVPCLDRAHYDPAAPTMVDLMTSPVQKKPVQIEGPYFYWFDPETNLIGTTLVEPADDGRLELHGLSFHHQEGLPLSTTHLRKVPMRAVEAVINGAWRIQRGLYRPSDPNPPLSFRDGSRQW